MGVRKELERSIHEYTASLRRYALVLTRNGDAAEDLVQETLVKAIAASESWEPGTDLRVWMFRIMHNTHKRAASPSGARASKADAFKACGHN